MIKQMKTKNKIAGIILLVCAVAIIVSAILLKSDRGKSFFGKNTGATQTGSAPSAAVSSFSTASQTSEAKSDDSMVYKNTDYGFKVTFPPSLKGYAVEKTPTDQTGVIAKYSVLLPTGDNNYKNKIASKAIAMEFYVYDPAVWAKTQKDGVRSTEIIEGEKYVYTYSIWEESPADLKTITDKDFVKIIETFELTSS